MILVYGNKYTENREEWRRQKPSNDFMEGVILTYLESVEDEYIYDGDCLMIGMIQHFGIRWQK